MQCVMRIREADRHIFEAIRNGVKTIETRAATVKYRKLAVGDTLVFTCGADRLSKTITKAYHWPSVAAMAKQVDIKQVLPEVSSLAEAEAAYAKWPGYAEKIKEHGLAGFELS